MCLAFVLAAFTCPNVEVNTNSDVVTTAHAKKKSKKTKKTKKTKKNKFNAKTAKKNIKVSYQETARGVLATYKNNNSYAVNFSASFKYYDGAGTVLSEKSIANYSFGKGKTMVYFFVAPEDGSGNFINYTMHKGTYSVKKSTYKDYTNKIELNTTLTPTACEVTTMNLAPKDLTSIQATFVFYDAAGNFIGAENQNFTCTKANTSQSVSVSYTKYSTVAAKVKVYKNWAY